MHPTYPEIVPTDNYENRADADAKNTSKTRFSHENPPRCCIRGSLGVGRTVYCRFTDNPA